MTQVPIPITALFDILGNGDAEYVAAKWPAERRPDFVSLHLHVLEITFIIECVDWDHWHALGRILLLQIVIFLLPRRLVLKIRIIKIVLAFTSSDSNTLSLLQYSLPNFIFVGGSDGVARGREVLIARCSTLGLFSVHFLSLILNLLPTQINSQIYFL